MRMRLSKCSHLLSSPNAAIFFPAHPHTPCLCNKSPIYRAVVLLSTLSTTVTNTGHPLDTALSPSSPGSSVRILQSHHVLGGAMLISHMTPVSQ